MDDPQYKAITDFLLGLGTDKVPHTEKAFLAHLIGVYRDLESWGCDATTSNRWPVSGPSGWPT